MTPSKLGYAAAAYAQRLGWSVLPLRPRSKVPDGRLVPHGVHDATTDLTRIVSWWRRSPHANIGIASGMGWIVLDIDPRNRGLETLAQLEDEHGPLPQTNTQLTGAQGYHYLYGDEEETKLPGVLGPGVDVKGRGGYIVVAPSVHPNGNVYRWDSAAHPLETAIAALPDWVRALAKAPRETRRLGTCPTDASAADSFLGVAFADMRWLGRRLSDGKVACRCPWVEQHSSSDSEPRTGEGEDSSTALLPPDSPAHPGSFRCLHGHCDARTTADVICALPPRAIARAAALAPRAFPAVARMLVFRGIALLGRLP
jgi:Bifunctional DNA primase/polymerase, N-terminal